MGEVAFIAVAALVIVSGFWVVMARNLVRAAVSLMGTLFGIAGLYVFLYADFLAAAQVVIYVGGILVILIFGVMLTHKISTPALIQTSMPRRWLAALTASFVAVGLWALIYRTFPSRRGLGVELTAWVDGSGTAGVLGHALMGKYLLHFEVASVLLLVALLGAAYLSRREHA